MASKMTIMKFEVEKLDGKNNFLLWKMRVMALLMKEGTHKALLGTEKKPSKTENDEWMVSMFEPRHGNTMLIR